jgi:hypothetical protein
VLRLRLRLGPHSPAVVRRVVMAAAAQADLPVDRGSEAELVAEIITLAAAETTPGGSLTIKLEPTTGSLKISAGPVRNGVADIIGRSDAPGPIISMMADEVWTEFVGDDEFLCFEVLGQRSLI